MSRGRFITLEGVDGAGKTTSVEAIQRFLLDRGTDLLVTREPGGTPLAETLRELLLATHDEAVDPLAETLLMFAARAQHVRTVIEPALAGGRWVLCDRFTDATRAYQGGGRGVDRDVIETLAGLVHPALEPDLTLYLDVPVEQARRRIGAGDLFGDEDARFLDRFERERASFHERVRAAYRELARSAPRVRVVDASLPEPEVARRIVEHLARFAAEDG